MQLNGCPLPRTPCNTRGEQVQAYTYDSNGNITKKTDFNGVWTTFGYDTTRNLETSRSDAANTSVARSISTTWQADVSPSHSDSGRLSNDHACVR